MVSAADMAMSTGMVIGYFILIIVIGNLAWKLFPKATAGLEGYVVAGKSLGWIVTLLSAMAAQYSALTFLGFIGYMYSFGAPLLTGIMGMYIFVSASYWMLFAARMWKLSKRFGHITPTDIMMQFYETKVAGWIYSIFMMLALFTYAMAQVLGIGYMINAATYGAISVEVGEVLVILTMIVSTLAGGQKAVGWVGALQGFLLLVGIVGGAFAFVHMLSGGMTSTFVTVAANPDLAKGLTIPGYVPVWGMVFLLSWIIPVGLGWPSHTHMYQKMISAKRSIISRAYPFIIAITFPLAILSGYVIAMTGRAFVTLPQGMRPDQIFVWQAQLYFHPLALGFIGAAGIAAMQSSLDAQAMGVASMVANDFAKRIGKITERGLARLTLAVRFILGILAIWAAITLPAPILKLGALSSAFGACTIPALTAALTGWRFATKHGLWTSVAGGFITTLVLAGQIPGTPKWLIHYGGIYAGFWGVIVSVVLLLLVSALTPGSRPSEKTVKAFKEVGW